MFSKLKEEFRKKYIEDNKKYLTDEFNKAFEIEINRVKDEWSKEKSILTKNINDEKEIILKKQEELKFLESRINDRRVELEKINEDLKVQIRILEAKASPSNVWAESFTCGFNKAWEMMQPIMTEGLLKSKKQIEDNAINETLKRNFNGNHKKNL